MVKKAKKSDNVVVKRSEKRVIGLFIDGTGLDRATRRIQRKVDMAALVRGVASGLTPVVARYYTLIPYEDDSRQRAFLDAVYKAGLAVVVRRLPPKGIERQVSIDIEMAADMVAFAMGHDDFSTENVYMPERDIPLTKSVIPLGGFGPRASSTPVENSDNIPEELAEEGNEEEVRPSQKVKRIVTVICPSRDLSYPLGLARELGADTVSADFGKFSGGGDVLKSAAKWIDLSDSETIWRD